MKIRILGIILILILILNSCASKKEIFYLQDIQDYNNTSLVYDQITIQPNDILQINVGALVPETAIPYNRIFGAQGQQNSIELMQLNGYLVTKDNTIVFPSLGTLSTENRSTAMLEESLEHKLTEGGFLNEPTVSVRILNAKVTVLGEVNNPGTYSFTEERITVLQALGYAGDLTIRGKREDVLIMREVDGIRKVTHINLTEAGWLDSPFYFVKPNDVIVINQNPPKVTSSGYIGDVGAILGLTSLILTVVILITN